MSQRFLRLLLGLSSLWNVSICTPFPALRDSAPTSWWLCSDGRALPWPPSTLPHSKEVVLALALCSLGGEASSCSGVAWASWCYQVWWHCFSRLLCSSLKGIGPGWLQITLPCWTKSHYSFWSWSPIAKPSLLCQNFSFPKDKCSTRDCTALGL